MSALLELAERCEDATGPDRGLNREVALVVGWHRYTPSEMGRSSPGWISPEDFIGEYVAKDGRRSPKLDSLHGTSISREPHNYLGSIDAAMSLIPARLRKTISINIQGDMVQALIFREGDGVVGRGDARFAPLALCAAALRARAGVA